MIEQSWPIVALKRALRPGRESGSLIKGDVSSEPLPGLVPGYSASGQDVWLASGTYEGPGLVLSAVGARCGKVFETSGRWGVVANTAVLLPQAGYHPHYLWYLVNSESFWEKGGAAQPYVRVAETLQRRLRIPSMGTQVAIAAYLDRETARIDALIEKKQRLAALIDARRISLAHAAITGATLHSDRAESGVPWLGSLPAHWSLIRIGAVFDVQLGRMLNQERASGRDMRSYLRNSNVQWDAFDLTDIAEMDFPPLERLRYSLHPGDLLITEGGEAGRAAIWQGEVDEMYFQKSILRARPLTALSVEWLLEWLRVAVDRSVFAVEGNVTTIAHLPAAALRAYRLPAPPADEAVELLALLTRGTRDIDRAKSALGHQLALLWERRQALITAAVTGQLAIPGAA